MFTCVAASFHMNRSTINMMAVNCHILSKIRKRVSEFLKSPLSCGNLFDIHDSYSINMICYHYIFKVCETQILFSNKVLSQTAPFCASCLSHKVPIKPLRMLSGTIE